MENLINPSVKAIKPYEPGKPLKELERELGISEAIKLASNENPLGPSKKVVAAINAALSEIHLYPDGGCYYLKQALAAKLGVEPGNLIFGNGSDEVIEIICRTFLVPGDEVMYGDCTFVEYEIISLSCGARGVCVPLKDFSYDLSAMAQAVTPATKIIFIANPNNPTGTMVTAAEFERFIQRLPEHVLVVMDEAYYEFALKKDFPRGLDYIRQGKPVIILRTFSKMYGLAGLRIGYGIADARIIAHMNKVRQPFNVNSLAQVAAIAALEDDKYVLETLEVNNRGKNYLYNEFNKLGLPFIPSETNFILFDTKVNCRKVYSALLNQGVIARPMDMYGLDTYLRVSIGTAEENHRFAASLERVLKLLAEDVQ